MKQTQTSSEGGQVLVILVLVIVGLLAFAALAIDGGMIFADRRGAQNAADAAVLAGGYRVANTLEDFNLNFNITYMNWDCDNVAAVMNVALPEAQSQAGSNSYPIAGESTLGMTCHDVDMGAYDDRYVDTDAIIVSDVSTSFVHLVFGGELKNTVQAISRVRPRMPLAFGYAIYAHRDDCPTGSTGGIQVEGNPTVDVQGAGMMSDACVSFSGSSITTSDGEINYISDYTGGGVVSPSPTQQDDPLPDWSLLFTPPNCDDLPTSSSSGDGEIYPGIYNGIMVTGGEQLTMHPGLYCFDGNFTINGNDTSFVVGNGVTIYMRSGNLTSNGNAAVRLSAPNYVVTDNDGVTGLLVYMGPDNDGEVSLLGNGNSYYSGTIYAESEDSTVEIGGTGDLTSCYDGAPCFGTQIIAGTVRLHGDATMDVIFNDNNVYHLPARLTLEK